MSACNVPGEGVKDWIQTVATQGADEDLVLKVDLDLVLCEVSGK